MATPPPLPTTKPLEANLTSTTSTTPRVLAVGPWHRREFSLVRQQIDPESIWPGCQTLEQASSLLEQQTLAPELLLLAQPRPGYYAQPMLARLQLQAPLARIVLVAGSWCEGELRTGQPAHGVLRLYWYDLAAWWRESLACQAGGRCPPWSEPLDDGYTQRIRTNRTLPRKISKSTKGMVEIEAIQYETFSALANLLIPAGWTAVWQRRNLQPTTTAGTVAGIWDGSQLDRREIDQLASFCQSLKRRTSSPVPVLVLLDFPRPEHLSMARTAGARTVLPKPYRVDDLLAELDR